MNLTAGQQTAIQSIIELQRKYPEGGGICVIGGYAGTGKTTLIQTLQEEHGDDLLVVTPTGKAAVRVREAAGARAQTIHRWLYAVMEDEKTGALNWQTREMGTVERPGCGVLGVDEASMVGFEMFRDLYRFTREMELNLVLIGDGFQLPPVESDVRFKDFSVFSPELPADYKVQLTEIVRQALDSPIVRCSRDIREGRWPEEALGQLPTVSANNLISEMTRVWEGEGATICHRNTTRHTLNSSIREARGLPANQLQRREPLLVTQNNYRMEVYNGEVVDVDTLYGPLNTDSIPVTDRFRGASCYVNFIQVGVRSPVLGPKKAVVCDREVFGTLGDVGPHRARRECTYLLDSMRHGGEDEEADMPVYLHSNLGYTLTCHKSQGSEFPEALVIVEDSVRLNTPEGRRWAYTAITRAKKRIQVCWR